MRHPSGKVSRLGSARRRRPLALAGVALGLLLGAPAAADDLPSGKLGLGGGLRTRPGGAAGVGRMLSLEAGYHPTNLERSFSFGVHWSIAGSWFGADPASITGSLQLLEMNLGLRVRRLVSQGSKRFLFVGAGWTLLRSNVPIGDSDTRDYHGPHGSLGAEVYVFDNYLVGLEGRYGLIKLGPSSISVVLSVSVGK